MAGSRQTRTDKYIPVRNGGSGRFEGIRKNVPERHETYAQTVGKMRSEQRKESEIFFQLFKG